MRCTIQLTETNVSLLEHAHQSYEPYNSQPAEELHFTSSKKSIRTIHFATWVFIHHLPCHSDTHHSTRTYRSPTMQITSRPLTMRRTSHSPTVRKTSHSPTMWMTSRSFTMRMTSRSPTMRTTWRTPTIRRTWRSSDHPQWVRKLTRRRINDPENETDHHDVLVD